MLSIDLLPEFGWSVQDEPVFGPGSVFQGFIRVRPDRQYQGDRIRLIFQGTERPTPIESGPGVVERRPITTLFAVQQILWKSDGTASHPSTFPFTIQMPMVQYPPAIDHPLYKCSFSLIAFLDGVDGKVIASCHRPVLYQPFLETTMLKSPYVQPINDALALQLDALDYCPGETITVRVRHKACLRQPPPAMTVLLELVQIGTVVAYQQGHGLTPKLTDVIASSTTPILLDTKSTASCSLSIPVQAPPSLTFSQTFHISYQLRVTLKKKQLLSSRIATFELPITLGTLGYGVRAADSLQLYTLVDYKSVTPIFMRAIEYNDTLPAYDPARLPSYDQTISLPHTPSTSSTLTYSST
ncbi:hypothetical protein BCR43DRAFT_494785 [Syncephalastrum racemosum]|uniref:Arrestin C-terminal-like domain-containing protein n=1 Tax=Syncephalastrum racemosum TaxID=13706 RepID=A0A1X2H8L2_SYNRA|nr:hypothetical protein BCR43DRAFT_494785 [Syncephalastrum racemosum]